MRVYNKAKPGMTGASQAIVEADDGTVIGAIEIKTYNALRYIKTHDGRYREQLENLQIRCLEYETCLHKPFFIRHEHLNEGIWAIVYFTRSDIMRWAELEQECGNSFEAYEDPAKIKGAYYVYHYLTGEARELPVDEIYNPILKIRRSKCDRVTEKKKA